MKTCQNCKHGDFVCVHYDINPYEQDWMGRCTHPVMQTVKGPDGLMDPTEYAQINICPFFNEGM